MTKILLKLIHLFELVDYKRGIVDQIEELYRLVKVGQAFEAPAKQISVTPESPAQQ